MFLKRESNDYSHMLMPKHLPAILLLLYIYIYIHVVYCFLLSFELLNAIFGYHLY